MKIVEGMLEILCRDRYGHQVAWDTLVMWQSIKTVLLLVLHRHLFTFPSPLQLLQSLQDNFFSKPSASVEHLRSIGSYTDFFPSGSLTEEQFSHNGDENTLSIASYGASARESNAGNSLLNTQSEKCSKHFSPTGGIDREFPSEDQFATNSEVPVVVPRVVSCKLEDRAYFRTELSPGNANANINDSTMQPPDLSLASRGIYGGVRRRGKFPLRWIDLLGMLLDAYMIFRPLLLVAAGRQSFRAHQLHDPSSMPFRPKELLESVLGKLGVKSAISLDDSKGSAVEEQSVTDKSNQKKVKRASVGSDLLMVRAVVEIPRQRSLFSSWKSWITFLVLDMVCMVLARIVRDRRIPVITIKQESVGSVPPLLQSDSEDDKNENNAGEQGRAEGEEEEERAPSGIHENHRPYGGTTTATSSEKATQKTSQGDRRMLECGQMIRTSIFRDPFFTIGLKKWIFDKIMLRIFSRIPLLGNVLNYQLGYYFMMQHFSFLYTLGM